MNIKKTIGTALTALFLTATLTTTASAEKKIISVHEIKNVDTIEDGVKKIMKSVNEYGMDEYHEQVDAGVEQPYFWLLKPLNKSADNAVDVFAPDFTKGINAGACFQKHFHINMEDGMSEEDAKDDAKKKVSDCVKNGESPLEGKFASTIRQMVLCQPKHGQLLLNKKKNLRFAAAMPCHISIYKKDKKVFVAWRNVHKMAIEAKLPKKKKKLAEEIQKAMKEMLAHLK